MTYLATVATQTILAMASVLAVLILPALHRDVMRGPRP